MKYLKYHEKKTRGTFGFPVEFYHVTPSHPQYEMSYHWHMEYEIILLLEGEFQISLDETKFTAKPGDVLFINDGILHGGIPADCIYECLVFDMQTFFKDISIYKKQFQGIMDHSILIHPFFPYSQDKLHELIFCIFETIRTKKTGYELIIIGGLYQLFGVFLEQHSYTFSSPLSEHNSKRIRQLKKVLSLIETSYHTCITLEHMAQTAGMNSKYFCRFFHEMTHRTPIDYLNYYRIECACHQIADSDASITDIAFSCGFNDISYFIKTFKKYKGITPKKYIRDQ